MNDHFSCEGCGEIFLKEWSDQEAAMEADAVFGANELADAGLVCDPCWVAMRNAMPDLDERYIQRGVSK